MATIRCGRYGKFSVDPYPDDGIADVESTSIDSTGYEFGTSICVTSKGLRKIADACNVAADKIDAKKKKKK